MEQVGLATPAHMTESAAWLSVAGVTTVAIPHVVSATTSRQGLARDTATTTRRRVTSTTHATVLIRRRSDTDQTARPPRRPPVLVKPLTGQGVVRTARLSDPLLGPDAPDAVTATRMAVIRAVGQAKRGAVRPDTQGPTDLTSVKMPCKEATRRRVDSPNARSRSPRTPMSPEALAAPPACAAQSALVAGVTD